MFARILTLPQGAGWLRWGALVLLVPWAAFWVWFNVASGLHEVRTEGMGAAVSHLAMAALMVAVVVVAWRLERVGGPLLIALALIGARWFFYPHDLRVPLLLLGPPLVAGALLTIHGWWLRGPGGPAVGG
jgi:uncharacterized membrane protein